MKTVFNILAMAIFLGVVVWRSQSGVGPNAEAFAGAPAPEEVTKAHEVLTLQGGVLIDSLEKAIFVAKTEGGIEALDLATGKTLWQTKKEDGMPWPVGVYGRTLVVRVRDNPLRIAALDLDAKGKMLWVTEPVLPEWVKGPEWPVEKPSRDRDVREWVPDLQRNKQGPNRQELELALLDKVKGTYRCEEHIEKGEFVMRWRAVSAPLDPPAKEASGVVAVDLETGKFQTRALEKDRQIQEKLPLPTEEWKGIVFSVAESLQVGDWAKTLPASRFIIEARMLRAVDKQTKKILWERALREWKYLERKGEVGR